MASRTVYIKWYGAEDVIRNMQAHERRIHAAVRAVAQYWKAELERYAKENAPWDDKTGNARQSLHTWIEEMSDHTVRVYLSHGVDYGIYLETMSAGKWAAIWPTIQANLPKIKVMLDGIFK